MKLKGFVNKNEATKLIIESDFMLIPSRIESIPVIFSDSIQLLRPVIAMPVGDLPFLLKKYKCGILSNSIDPVAYALSISKALNGPPVMAKRRPRCGEMPSKAVSPSLFRSSLWSLNI